MIRLHVFLFTICVSSSVFAITGGSAVQPTEPIAKAVVVIIEDHPAASSHCTATLIAPNVVLTAAHCADDLEPERARSAVYLVTTPTSLAPCASSTVAEISYPPSMKHNDYTRVPSPDLALLRLKSPLCGVTPANIDDAVKASKAAHFRTAGYGEGTADRARWPDRLELSHPGLSAKGFLAKYYEPLRKKNFPEATGEKYYQWFKRLLAEFEPFEKFLVPVTPSTSLCKGDSGGPVYQEKDGRVLLMGVNSGVLPHPEVDLARCNNGFTQLIQPIEPHLKWIRNTMTGWR